MNKISKKKIGLFGGSFDPPHKGHEYVVSRALSYFDLDEIYLIPSYQTPLKEKSKTQETNRLKMLEQIFQGHKKVKILDFEIKRKKKSYTINTLNKLNLKDEVYLILGEDVFLNFHKWKDFEKILNQLHLIVFLRTRENLTQEEIPLPISQLVQSTTKKIWRLKNKNKIIFYPPHESLYSLSSSQIKNQLQFGVLKKELISQKLYSNIKNYYNYLSPLSQKDLQKDLIQFLEENGALNSRIFHFEQRLYEYLLLTSGLNSRHVRFLTRSLKDYMKEKYGLEPEHIEGEEFYQWVVFDYGFLIIHIFYDYLRKYYQLEELWDSKENFKKD